MKIHPMQHRGEFKLTLFLIFHRYKFSASVVNIKASKLCYVANRPVYFM